MELEQRAKEHLNDLLKMSEENFEEMSGRWEGFDSQSMFNVKNVKEFQKGYVFGKIEHKFISWFYAEFGRSQSDEEYLEFWKTVMDRIAENKNLKS